MLFRPTCPCPAADALAARHLPEGDRRRNSIPVTPPISHLDRILQDAGTSIVITVEEAPLAAGWGAEMIATIAQLSDARGGAPSPVAGGAENIAIPSAQELENALPP